MRRAKRIVSIHTLKRVLSVFHPENGSPYLINILHTYVDNQTHKLMVKFKYSDNRIGGCEEVNTFINSPLIYFVHPKQLFLLGHDYQMVQQQVLPTEQNSIGKNIVHRFKRVFYRG